MSDARPVAVLAPVRSTMADDEDFAELLREFTDALPQKRETVRSLQSKVSDDELRVFAHQLKGSAGGYGFPGLTEVAAELEQACKAHNMAEIAKTVDRLVEYMGRIEA
jgi:histidine phosphotransfer protein HptB